MIWNRPRVEAPPFSWDGNKLLRAEWMFLSEAGTAVGLAMHLPEQEQSDFVVDALVRDALATAELEGEVLDALRVKACVRRRLGLAFDESPADELEAGVAALMADMLQNASKPVAVKTLTEWRGWVTEGATGETGRGEMRHFVRWLGRSSAEDDIAASPLVHAGIAHLWLESAHPYAFGTGIMGRALAQKTLMKGVPCPNFMPLAQVMQRRQKEYFAALDNACRDRDATFWLVWFASAAMEAVRENKARAEFAKRKVAFLNSLRDRVCGRQEDVLKHLFENENDAFRSGVSASAYARLTGVSTETARDDLRDLVALGALAHVAKGRSAAYFLNIAPPDIQTVGVDEIA